MTQKERMLRGLPYKAWLDGLPEEHLAAQKLTHAYNLTPPDATEERDRLLRALLGGAGAGLHIEPPFFCDYGRNITVGDAFYANFHCTILDVGPVVIGDHVKFGPNVSLYTAGHPLHPDSRNSGYEYGIGITIGDNVWLCGNVVVNPGVHIGDNVVVGSGSVVTRDLPPNVLACGNPCRVVRAITEADRQYYYKDRVFDVEDYR